jgi:malate dehydrogenase (oxaloacetate-decarboxylating)
MAEKARPTVGKQSTEELVAKATKPGEDALRLHPIYQGKLEVILRCSIKDCDDFSIC